MNEELEIVNLSMEFFGRIKLQIGKNAFLDYLNTLPDAHIKGAAHQLIRKHLSSRAVNARLQSEEKEALAARACQQIFNEIIQKVRQKKASKDDEQLDGAELFYRRALNHIAMERYPDAERLLKRSVEISPSFIDGWKALAEVLEHNGKHELARQARLKFEQFD